MKDKVYYDESCYICSLEINMIRERGEACDIEFVDISDRDFGDNSEYKVEMIGEFNGSRTVGAETFRKMYEKLGFKKAVAFSRLPVVKQIFDFGYWVFARLIRPYLPKRKV